jgi:hypothetical protein
MIIVKEKIKEAVIRMSIEELKKWVETVSAGKTFRLTLNGIGSIFVEDLEVNKSGIAGEGYGHFIKIAQKDILKIEKTASKWFITVKNSYSNIVLILSLL